MKVLGGGLSLVWQVVATEQDYEEAVIDCIAGTVDSKFPLAMVNFNRRIK